MSDIRSRTKDLLSKYIKNEKNLEIAEKRLYSTALSVSKERKVPKDEIYNELLYEFIHKLLKKVSLKVAVDEINKNVWDWGCFREYANIQQSEDNSTQPEIEEGIHECGKCSSKKAFSYQLQLSSGDEGMTLFVKCAMCGNSWKGRN